MQRFLILYLHICRQGLLRMQKDQKTGIMIGHSLLFIAFTHDKVVYSTLCMLQIVILRNVSAAKISMCSNHHEGININFQEFVILIAHDIRYIAEMCPCIITIISVTNYERKKQSNMIY